MILRIPNTEIQEILTGVELDFPKYTTQLMNLANQNSQGTRAKVVGQMSDLIQEFTGDYFEEWSEWYLEKNPEAIDNATEKVFDMVEKLKDAIVKIDKDLVRQWIEDLVITKTFSGLKFQEIILKKLASINKTTYRLAIPEEESKGIDGYIGDNPVSIKPMTYKAKLSLNEEINIPIIFYKKNKANIAIEFDETKIL